MIGPRGLPVRRSIRLSDFDYAEWGAYFITICAERRRHTFGRVHEDRVEYFLIGKIVKEMWESIPKHFAHVELDEYVVMPNHMHGILVLCKRGNEVRQPERFSIPVKGSVPTILRSYKSAVTKQVHLEGLQKGKVLQANYYENVIRSEGSFDRVRRYIRNNPQKWYRDRMNGHPVTR